MTVIEVVSGISRASGGPSRSVQGLVAGLCKAGVEAWLLTLRRGDEPWVEGIDRFVNGEPFEDAVARIKPDVVHLHGLWDPALHRAAVVCRKRGIPYVIAPRGMLEPWSLRQKWLKKRIARWLYQDKDLKCAAALHATAESEAEQFRKLGFWNPIIISPNGVNVPGLIASRQSLVASSQESVVSMPSRSFSEGWGSGVRGQELVASRQSLVVSGGRKRILFVSRMHPKKGVLELVEAWGKLVASRQSLVASGGVGELGRWEVELVYTVSGELEREYEAKVKTRVKELELENGVGEGSFVFTGALNDDEKWNAYARADLFVLPTYSENFGIVVAEALWAGVPVITTKGTPWQELEDRKCGWWIDTGVDPLAAALKEAMSLSDAERREMGARGKALVEEKYTWDAVVREVVKGYAACLAAEAAVGVSGEDVGKEHEA